MVLELELELELDDRECEAALGGACAKGANMSPCMLPTFSAMRVDRDGALAFGFAFLPPRPLPPPEPEAVGFLPPPCRRIV